MFKKSIYFTIIISLSAILLYYFDTSSPRFTYEHSGRLKTEDLINKNKYNPSRLFLSTWNIVKTKYYDSTLNNQDWYRWKKRYIDQIKTQDDAYIAINSMLASLNDPYSRFLNDKEYLEQNTDIDSKITGIGVNIINISGKITILNVVENTPAYKNDIKAGDIILKVNNKDVQGTDITNVANQIRGEIGSTVVLELIRNNKKLTKTITREEIAIANIKYKVIDKDIAYIQILNFIGQDVPKEFLNAIEQTQDTKKLIIDLRGNPGGLLPNAILIANMFLQNGKIVSIVDRNGLITSINAEKKDFLINKPTVILIDESTASASEILSGALKDSNKAILIGEKTYGKGMIQKIYPLPNKTGMNLTIAKYLTPNGTDINKIGIKPDINVQYTFNDYLNHKDPQLEKAKQILKKDLVSK